MAHSGNASITIEEGSGTAVMVNDPPFKVNACPDGVAASTAAENGVMVYVPGAKVDVSIVNAANGVGAPGIGWAELN